MTPFLSSLRVCATLFVALAALQTHAAPGQDAKDLVGACMACHPKSAVPANSVNPIIWGQNEGYLYLQLRDFKRAARASERNRFRAFSSAAKCSASTLIATSRSIVGSCAFNTIPMPP